MRDDQVIAVIGLIGFTMLIIGAFKILSTGVALVVVGGVLFILALKAS